MGATVVRVSIPTLDELTRGLNLMNLEFKAAFDSYLAGLGPVAPVKNLAEFVARGEVHESMRSGLDCRSRGRRLDPDRPNISGCWRGARRLRQAVMTVMAANKLDAILYPHQKRLVVPIGEDQADRNGVLSNSTGFPALTFPGGFSPRDGNRADRRAGWTRVARARVERARAVQARVGVRAGGQNSKAAADARRR